MQIEHHIHRPFLAPRHHAVRQVKPKFEPALFPGNGLLFDGQREEVVVQRDPDRIEPPSVQGIDVRFPHVVVQPRLVKRLRRLRPNEGFHGSLDFMLWVGEGLRLQHVAFLHHPTAQSHAPQHHLLTQAILDLRALGLEPGRVLTASCQGHRGPKQGGNEGLDAELHAHEDTGFDQGVTSRSPLPLFHNARIMSSAVLLGGPPWARSNP